MNEAEPTNTGHSSLVSSHPTDTAKYTETKEQNSTSETNSTVTETSSQSPTETTETEAENSGKPKQETGAKSESSETSKESETKENKAQANQKPSVYNMCLLLTFAICLSLQYTAYSRLLRNVKESPKVGYKWEARRDIKLPIKVPFTHIADGDITKLERVIAAHYMTVAVFYAPWSRPSQRVIEYFSELVSAWADTDVEFVAINCWTQGTLCKESYNSWDYPQILIYHQNVDYIPYIYALSTYPSAFATELERLYEPVLFADSMEELTNLLVKHQRSVIGLFSSFEGNKDYTEFSKAALIHHLEFMDSYYVPFIVLGTHHVDVLESVQLNNLIYKYVLFETLSPFQGRHQRLRHREILNWLKVSGSEMPIKYLGHHGFNSLANNSVSVVLASPLHQNSENYVNYMRAVMSYKHCNVLPELKIHCKPNRTCLNPCLPDQALSRDTILPCFLPRFRTPSIVQQCYFNRQRMSLMPRSGAALSHKMSEDLTVLIQHTFLESEVMCSASYEGTCTQCTEVEQLQSDLEFSIRQATNVHHTPYHGHGCSQSNAVFYALDTVIWADMVTRFGVNNTDRSFTEALVKTDRQGKTVFTIDLTNSSLDINEKFWTFLKGSQADNEGHFQNPSGVNKESESSSEETDADSDKEFIKEISRLDLLTLQDDTTRDYLVFVYTKWCGYCHVMKRKLEAAARLLRSTTSVSFVAIDSDINNNLYGSKLVSDRVPRVYLLLRNSHSPALFERRTEKPASVKDIIKFIKFHIPGSKFHSSHNARVHPAPSIPCMSWLPLPPPPPPPNVKSELNLAYAQTSPIDTILETLDSAKGSDGLCPLQQKLKSPLNTQRNKHTDNLPNNALETMTLKEKSSVLQSREMVCVSTRHLFKALSRSSRIDPYKMSSVTVTLVRDLHDNLCLKGNIADLWRWLGAGCFKHSWDRLPCKFLLVASELASLHGNVPGEIIMILEAQEVLADKLLRKAKKAMRFNGREPTEGRVHEFERFYIRNCYNFNNELLFYLTGTCSYLCRLTCRTVNKLH